MELVFVFSVVLLFLWILSGLFSSALIYLGETAIFSSFTEQLNLSLVELRHNLPSIGKLNFDIKGKFSD